MSRGISVPLAKMLVYRSIKLADILNLREERHKLKEKGGTVRVKCLAQEHNKVLWSGFETRPLDPESSQLTVISPRLPHQFTQLG